MADLIVSSTIDTFMGSADQKAARDNILAQVQSVEKTTNFTAELGGVYMVTATLTVSDPTPAQAMMFVVNVRNGTATVGGTAYAVAGTQIVRCYHSGAWQNYVYFPSPLQASSNLSDLTNASTARTNLGLGTAATQASTAFDAAGAAASAQAASLQITSNLSDLNNAATARTNLGLGTAATQATTTFLQVANNLSDVNNAATSRSNLGVDKLTTATADSNYTVLNTDKFVSVGAITLGRTMTMPAASTTNAGQVFIIADTAGTCTGNRRIAIAPNGSDTINGVNATTYIYTMFGRMTLISNGSNGYVATPSCNLSSEFSQINGRNDLMGYESDLCWGANGAIAAGRAGLGGLESQVTGTGAALNVSTTSGEYTNSGLHIGVVDFVCGTVATNRIRLVLNDATLLYFGIGAVSFHADMYTPTLMDGSTHQSAFEVGFTTSTTTGGSPSQAACFMFDPAVNTTYWLACTADNGSRTKTVLDGTAGTVAFPFAAETAYHRLGVEVDATGANVRFFRDGVLMATNTTNIPKTSTRPVGCKVSFNRSVGTASATYIILDRIGVQLASTSVR